MSANPFAWSAPPIEQIADRLTSATDAGVPLDELFLALADDADNRHVRRVAQALAARLAAGDDLPAAVAASESLLPRPFRDALAVATDPSQTAPLLRGLAAHEAARRRLKRRIRSAVLYPAIVIALLVAVTLGLCITVVPEYRDSFLQWDEWGMETPAITRFLFRFTEIAPWLAVGLALLPIALWLLGFLPGGRRTLHWLRTGVPFAGRLWISSSQHEFASMMAELTGARMRMEDALRCTAASLRDRNVARAARIVASKCEQGVAFSQGLAESLHFDRVVAGLAAWGEANQNLPEALRQAVEHYEVDVEQQAAFIGRIAPPILYVSVLSIVFFFVVALFMPFASSISSWMWW